MSTELKGVKCRTGEVGMTKFMGNFEERICVQLTFKSPEEERFKPTFGWWYIQLTRDQARELAQALVEFADGTREKLEEE